MTATTSTSVRSDEGDQDERSESTETVPTGRPPTGGTVRRIHVAGLALGIALAVVGINRTDLGAIDGLGLYRAMSLWFYVGAGVVVVGFVVAALTTRVTIAWWHLVAMIGLLHGAPGFLEPNPRFTTAWLHVGFANQIAADGELLPFYDARFSWPGFFTAGAFLQRLSGTESVLWLLRFTPVVVNLLAIMLVWNLARALGSRDRSALIACGLFAVTNWIGQDYFAPQAIGFLITLFVVTVVLRVFPAVVHATGWRRLLFGRTPPGPELDPVAHPRLIYAGIIFTIFALAVTHQLSPVFLGLILLLLGLFERTSTAMLSAITFLLIAAWLSFGAETYWLGHLDTLFGSAGQPDDVLGANVTRRTTGGSDARQTVLTSRLGLTAAMWAATGLVLVYRRLRNRLDPAYVALLFGPFVAVMAQPYGGELLLRVAIFTLPVCSIVIAQAITTPRTRFTVAPIALLFVGLIPLFVLTRFGNEAFERTYPEDVALVEDLYAVAPERSVVFVSSRQTILDLERVGDVRFRTLPTEITPAETIDLLEATAQDRDGGVYLLLSRSQAAFGVERNGRDPQWMADFGEAVLSDPDIVLESRRGAAVLMAVGIRS